MTTRCIDLDVLADYFGGDLSDEEKIRMMEHLTECRFCVESFASANHIMKNPDLTEWEPAAEPVFREALRKLSSPKTAKAVHRPVLADRFADFCKRLAGAAAGWFRVPEFAPVRSNAVSWEEDISLNRAIDDLETEIYVEEIARDRATLRIKVMKNNEKAKNISLTLINDSGKIFARNLLSDFVRFDDIPPGSYQFILEQNGAEKGNCFFEINENGLYEKDNLS